MTELELAQNLLKPPIHLKNPNHEHPQQTNAGKESISIPESGEGDGDGVGLYEVISGALCRGDLYHWLPGDYELAGDPYDPGLGTLCLEASVCFNCEG